MIITQLSGGLGNQMFQYALGRVLAIKNDTELKADITPFNYQPHTDTKRSYALDVYKLPITIATEKDLNWLGKTNRYKIILNKYFALGLNPYPDNYTIESDHDFNPKILKLSDNSYLSGYWQSEKYFKNFRKTLIEDFSSRNNPLSSKNMKLAKAIKESKSISVHIRRSDYITNKASNAFHGVCDLNYYRSAMSYIERHIKEPVYYVFSDDPEWTQQNIKSKHKTVYISHNTGNDAHEDIRLMSQCSHNIIANSSFSWWGAWLNHNSDKIIVAPKKWFNDKNVSYNDLIPQEWIRK